MKHLRSERGGVGARHVYWDVETINNMLSVVCVCAVTDDNREFAFRSIQDWADAMVDADLAVHQVVHWSHWGGIFDHLHALQVLLPAWEISEGCAGDGFGAWSIDLRKDGHWIRLRDSARLMPGALAEIGAAFGEAKDESINRAETEQYTWERLAEYCLQDCRVLRRALEDYRVTWAELGIETRGTLAATATAAIRKNWIPEDAWGWDPSTDDLVARAYHGGRTERFSEWLQHGRCYDIRSSYPAAMSRPLPTRLVRHVMGRLRPRRGRLQIIRARVRVPRNVRVGPLPFVPTEGVLAGRLLFPTGEWDGVFCDEELVCARRLGWARVLHVYETWEYESEPWLKPYVDHWWTIRKAETNEARRYVAKIALNGVSGKLIERPERETLTTNERRAIRALVESEMAELGGDRHPVHVRIYQELKTASGSIATLYLIQHRREGSFRHAAAAAYVTARGRVALLEGVAALMAAGEAVAYVDTDSIFTTGTLPTGEELGDWNCESEFQRATFLRPKVYAYQRTDGRWIHKAKGFGLPRLINPDAKLGGTLAGFGRVIAACASRELRREAWESIAEGNPFQRETTRHFRGGMSVGDIRFARVVQVRQLRFGLDKRHFTGQSSRPWHVDELASLRNPRLGVGQ